MSNSSKLVEIAVELAKKERNKGRSWCKLASELETYPQTVSQFAQGKNKSLKLAVQIIETYRPDLFKVMYESVEFSI